MTAVVVLALVLPLLHRWRAPARGGNTIARSIERSSTSWSATSRAG